MTGEGTAQGFNQEVEIASNNSDDEEVNGQGSRADFAGGQVNDYGGGDSYPHLSYDVGEDECEEAPGVG